MGIGGVGIVGVNVRRMGFLPVNWSGHPTQEARLCQQLGKAKRPSEKPTFFMNRRRLENGQSMKDFPRCDSWRKANSLELIRERQTMASPRALATSGRLCVHPLGLRESKSSKVRLTATGNPPSPASRLARSARCLVDQPQTRCSSNSRLERSWKPDAWNTCPPIRKIKGRKNLVIHPSHSFLINHPSPSLGPEVVDHLHLSISFLTL